jgi:2-C-methyl-D-erythritol 4-phosphate cytidylyltransferase
MVSHAETAAIVLAAGRGERLGHTLPKAFVPLRGVSLIERSIRAMQAVSRIGRIVPVVGSAELDRYATLALSGATLQSAVPGGEERQDSVLAGLAALSGLGSGVGSDVDSDLYPDGVEWVAVHDAARCLVTPAEIEAVLDAAQETGAAILARPAADTIKRVRGDSIAESPPRAECWAAQTPQVFRRSLLQEAVDKAVADGFVGTDEAELVARLGVRVRVARGEPSNLKITEPVDLAAAEAWLERMDEPERGVGR